MHRRVFAMLMWLLLIKPYFKGWNLTLLMMNIHYCCNQPDNTEAEYASFGNAANATWEDNMTPRVCLYQIGYVSYFNTCSNSTETNPGKPWKTSRLFLVQIDLWRENWIYTITYRNYKIVTLFDLRAITRADSGNDASSRDMLCVTRPTLSEKK